MGWPFRKKPPPDPSALRDPEPTWGVGGGMGAGIDFLGLAGNEGAASLAQTAAALAPEGWRWDAGLHKFAENAREANDAIIGSRVARSGMPMREAVQVDVTDPRVRLATFTKGSAMNPDTGGAAAWRAGSAERVRDWNVAAAGDVAPLEDPAMLDHPMGARIVEEKPPRGLMFGRRR